MFEPLPESFLFGVATSDHQCEAFDPRWPDIRDLWESEHGLPLRGRATDFWNRFPEDVDLAKSLGCRAFRFSLAWARVEPEPGRFDAEVLAHYRDVAAAIRRAGMEPIPALLHMTWPVHVQERGGMLSPEFPDWFARYAGEAARALRDFPRFWITFNEPTMLPFGYVRMPWQRRPAVPPGPALPGRRQPAALAVLMQHLFAAHTRARAEIRKVSPGARVGANPLVLGFPDAFQASLDRNLCSLTAAEVFREPAGPARARLRARARRRRDLGTTLTMLNQNWWYLGMAGKLPRFLCPPECVGAQDFVGLDYYWGLDRLRPRRLWQLLQAVRERWHRAPVWPEGLYQRLRHIQRLFPGQEIMVLESGCVSSADGYSRSDYLRSHIRQVQRAHQAGIPVTAFICWSLTSSREWDLPFRDETDFGLFRIDLDGDPSLTRHPTETAEVYCRIIRNRGVTEAGEMK